uniref:leukemia inhibitory factor receptor-like n=1 Tax=Myxine glutinosa TaxID=7769 RepID=UPI00358F2042
MCTVRSLGQEANFFEAAREMNWNLLNLIVIATVSFHVAGVDSCRITPDNIIAEVGGNLMATCDYSGDAIAGDVRWLHNNTSLSSEVIVHQNSTSSTIKLTTLKASRLNGDNLICLPSLNHLCGTLVFVGNRPETPKSLSCKTGDLVNLHCTWDRGNDTNLQFKNESTYRLHYNVSNGESGSVKAAQSNALLRSLKRNQNYTLWVEVFNALGRRASAPLKLTPLSAFQPSPPQDVTVSPGVVLINVTWTVEHADLELQCEVYAQEANTWQDKTVVRLQAFPQKPQLSMGTTVEGLVPYTPYDVSVRCHHNTDGRWSSWSNVKSTQTKEGAPSKAPTLWRNFIRTEKTNNTSIMLVWKPLKQAEAHGLVHSYHLHLSTGTAGSVPDKKIVNANETTFYLERGGVRAELMAQTIGGLSPPSSLYIPVMDPAGSIKHRRQVVGDGKCIHLNWGPRLAAISYIVEWKLVEQPAIGKLGWKEIEGNTSTAKICSANGDDIIPFRRYQVAVHAKQNDGNMLIDQAEAYLEEDVPERGPHVQHQESLGSVSLLIKGLPISACRGFLTSYTLYVTLEEHKTRTQEHKTKLVHDTYLHPLSNGVLTHFPKRKNPKKRGATHATCLPMKGQFAGQTDDPAEAPSGGWQHLGCWDVIWDAPGGTCNAGPRPVVRLSDMEAGITLTRAPVSQRKRRLDKSFIGAHMSLDVNITGKLTTLCVNENICKHKSEHEVLFLLTGHDRNG